MKPLVVINFKLYPEAVGKKTAALARLFSKSHSQKYQVVLVPPTSTLSEIRTATQLPLFAQHVDAVQLGAYTGHLSPAELKQLHIQGTILNHSERKLPVQQLQKTIQLCKQSHLQTIVCASTIAEIKKIAHLHPHYLAYEPRALIGGNVSVTSARPEIITEAVKITQKISPTTKVLCGAGVHRKEDLQTALQLGAKGVLLSHAMIKAKNPRQKLKELLS